MSVASSPPVPVPVPASGAPPVTVSGAACVGLAPLALVGVGCRFPGGASDPRLFWSNLVSAVDGISDAPADRWNASYFTDRDPHAPARIPVSRGGFADHALQFDCDAFGVSSKEAEQMDPQQKILLEVALQALEDASIPGGYSATNMGVFVGIGQAEQLGLSTHDLDSVNAYSVTGSALSIAANRLSYCFDLRGPSLAIDTACSSSMSAFHMAAESIRRGDCDAALVAGVNVILSPAVMIQFAKLGVLAPDGRCKSFSDAANGYVRSEGAGVVVLRRLSDAQRDGSQIYAVVRGSALNQDGHQSPSLTMPTAEAQQAVFTAACVQAQVCPSDIIFAEAHATGTKVGDPIEANALGAVFGSGRKENGKPVLRLGSVKTNVGHLETASFMAGLIKSALMLRHRTLVPNLYAPGLTAKEADGTVTLFKPNPNIRFADFHMVVQDKVEPFPAEMREPLIAISSFGFGGSNGCVILQGYDSQVNVQASDPPPPPYLFMLSAASPDALSARIDAAGQFEPSVSGSSFGFDARAPPSAFDVAHTLSRAQLHRHVAVGIGADLKTAAFGAARKMQQTQGGAAPPVVWVFAGQGPQHPEMGRQLYERFPVFRASIDACDAIYQRVAAESLVRDVGLFGPSKGPDSNAVYKLQYTLPALVFLQVALCDLWWSLGVKPAAVLGHSFGEMAAAYASGACQKEAIVVTAFHRARLLGKIDGLGVMMAVGAGAQVVQPWLDQLAAEAGKQEAWIAAYNGPNSCTVGGVRGAVDAVAARCLAAGLFHRVLKITNAYHTPLMAPVRDEALSVFAESLASTVAPVTPYISTVDGQWKTTPFDQHYTWAGIEGAVLFQQAIEAALQRFGSGAIFMELAAHPVLSSYLTECAVSNAVYTLHREQHEVETTLRTVASLRIQGCTVSLAALADCVNGAAAGAVVSTLLPYPFQRTNCFREDADHRVARLVPHWKALAGVPSAHPSPTYTAKISTHSFPWTADHVVQGAAVFPAAGHVEMLMEGLDTSCVVDVIIGRAMLIPNPDAHNYRTVRQVLQQAEDAGAAPVSHAVSAKIFSKLDQWDSGAWTLHSQATRGVSKAEAALASAGHGEPAGAAVSASSAESVVELLAGAKSRCTTCLPETAVYERFASVGLRYSNLFRCIISLHQGDEEAYALLDVRAIRAAAQSTAAQNKKQMVVHPALLDCCFQVLLGTVRYLHVPLVPTSIKRVEWLAAGDNTTLPDTLIVYTRSRLTQGLLLGDITICDAASGAVLGTVEGMQCTPLGSHAPAQPSFVACWQPWAAPLPKAGSPAEQLPRHHWERAFAACNAQLSHVESVLNGACVAYMSAFFDANQVSAKPVAPQASWPAHRLRYWNWCVQQVADYKGTAITLSECEAAMQALGPQWRMETEAIRRIGSNLRLLLSDPSGVQRVLFAEGDSFMTDLYAQAPTFQPFVELCAQQVVAELAAHPNRVVTILELGGGTGGLTAIILERLLQEADARTISSRLRYIFTDVSAKFINDARARFAQHAFLQYQTFDVEQEPTAQGVDLHSVDLVLAFDVLHVAADLSVGIEHVKRVLAPRGRLVLLELTRPWMWTQLFFGVFKQWWSFTDDRSVVTLTRQQWSDKLAAHAFQQVRVADNRSEEEMQTGVREFCHAIITAHAPDVHEWISDAPLSAATTTHRHVHVFDATQPANDIDRLLQLALQLIDAKEPCDLYLLTQGAQNINELTDGCNSHSQAEQIHSAAADVPPMQAPLVGFARVLANEYPLVRVKMLDFAVTATASERSHWLATMQALAERTVESEFAVRDGQLLVPKFVALATAEQEEEVIKAAAAKMPPVNAAVAPHPADHEPAHEPISPFRLEIPTPGQLSSLRFHHFALPAELGAMDVLVRVHAAALNFKDLMLALGMLSNPTGLDAESLAFARAAPPLGLEFSGVVVSVGAGVRDYAAGDPVFGFASDCFASHVVTSASLLARKPAHLSHAEAVSMPIVFATAYSGLVDKARIEKGETVLVHSAAGGLGQAAIQLCQHRGAKVIATVGSQDKRDYLSRIYGVSAFADSHSNASWKRDVATLTQGRGVDCVVNSLKGEAIPFGLESLAIGGRFIEYGKIDILANKPLPLGLLLRDVSFLSVQLDILMASHPERMQRLLHAVSQLAAANHIRPIVDRVFPFTEAEAAFRYLMAGAHKGKVIIDFMPTAPETCARIPQLLADLSPPSQLFHSDSVYVLSGGCGAVALKIVRWMATQGARHLLLLSRRGAAALRPSEARDLASLRRFGVQVAVEAADICSSGSVEAAYSRAIISHSFPAVTGAGSVRVGLLHLAMVLDDDALTKMTPARMDAAMRCKVQGAVHLVQAFPAAAIDFAIFFSSAASVLGNPGQANYAAGNAFLDSYAHSLSCLSGPAPGGRIRIRARVINLGVVEDVGVLAEDYKLRQLLTAKGFVGGLSSDGVCQMIARVLRATDKQVQFVHGSFDWAQICQQYPSLRARFAHLVDHRATHSSAASGSGGVGGGVGVTVESMSAHLSVVLGVPVAKLDPADALTLQGLDSLLAVELSATLKKKFGVTISQMELLGGCSIQHIVSTAQAQAQA